MPYKIFLCTFGQSIRDHEDIQMLYILSQNTFTFHLFCNVVHLFKSKLLLLPERRDTLNKFGYTIIEILHFQTYMQL